MSWWGNSDGRGRWRTNEEVFWYVDLAPNFNRAAVFERSSNPPCSRVSVGAATRTSDVVFICDIPVDVVTFFQRRFLQASLFRRAYAARHRCLFIFRQLPILGIAAVNVCSSKQFFKNAFGVLKVAPFCASLSDETKDTARRRCLSPNGNAVTVFRVSMSRLAIARMHVVHILWRQT